MTFNPPGFKTFMVLAVGFGLRTLSRMLERVGDYASEPGVRLFNHVSALVVLIAAGACFIWACKMMFFDKPREKAEPVAASTPAAPLVDIYAERREADNFDPDAALARYMGNRNGADPDQAPATKPGGFGRKGL